MLLPEAPPPRHPDYWEDDRVANLKVNEIRLISDEGAEFHPQSLQAFLNLKPSVGRRRVAVIGNVGRLPDVSQNLMLKTLEEPPGHVLFVLCTTEAHKLPATIVSRCQRFGLSAHHR